METNSKMIMDVHERPNLFKWLVLAIQHVFAMFGATILVPVLINASAGEEVLSIPVTLVASGVGTLAYIICTKGRSPVYLGSSFAFITPVIVAFGQSGKPSVFTALMLVGFVYAIVALIIKFIGNGWINKLLPPVVVGPMIMIIGLSLAPAAIGQIGLNKDVVAWQNIVAAVVALSVTIILVVKGRSFFKIVPFLIGIASGYIVGIALGLVDFTGISNSNFFAIPNFYIPLMNYSLDFAAVLTIVPIVLVTMSEHIGDHKVLSQIIGKDLLKNPGLEKTLLGDGLATMIAALLGGPANTTYGENTSVIGITKVASIWVIGLAAIIAIVFGFLGTLTAIIASIPAPVLGGVAILLYGFIAMNGLKILVESKVDFGKVKNVIITAVMLVLGLGGALVAIKTNDFSLTISGMSLAAVIGVLLNIIIPEE